MKWLKHALTLLMKPPSCHFSWDQSFLVSMAVVEIICCSLHDRLCQISRPCIRFHSPQQGHVVPLHELVSSSAD